MLLAFYSKIWLGRLPTIIMLLGLCTRLLAEQASESEEAMVERLALLEVDWMRNELQASAKIKDALKSLDRTAMPIAWAHAYAFLKSKQQLDNPTVTTHELRQNPRLKVDPGLQLRLLMLDIDEKIKDGLPAEEITRLYREGEASCQVTSHVMWCGRFYNHWTGYLYKTNKAAALKYLEEHYAKYREQSLLEKKEELTKYASELGLKYEEEKNKRLERDNQIQRKELEEAEWIKLMAIVFGCMLLVMIALGTFAFHQLRKTHVADSKKNMILSNIAQGICTIEGDINIGKDYTSHINRIFRSGLKSDGHDAIEQLFGASQLSEEQRDMGLQSLSQQLHALESGLLHPDQGPLPIGKLDELLREYRRFVLNNNIRLQKVLVEDAVLGWSPEIASASRQVITHALNNSLDHGFIFPRSKGKALSDPCITITAQEEAGLIRVTLEDNGGGLDLAKLQELALQKGFRPEKDQTIADVVFEDGVSTAEAVSLSSGRGVGMSAIKQICEELGGTARIGPASSTLGTRVTFTFAKGSPVLHEAAG